MPFAATRVDLEITILSEIRTKEANALRRPSDHMESKRVTQMSLSMTQRQTHRHRTGLRLSRGGKDGVGVSGQQMEAIL